MLKPKVMSLPFFIKPVHISCLVPDFYIFHQGKADTVYCLFAASCPEAKCLVKRQAERGRVERDQLRGKVFPQQPEQPAADSPALIISVHKEEAAMALFLADTQHRRSGLPRQMCRSNEFRQGMHCHAGTF